MLKTNYYYIDEAGHLKNDSQLFIHGCIITDNRLDLEKSIIDLKESLKEKPYFMYSKMEFMTTAFHAADDHPDVRAEFYNLISILNYRSYFVLLNKSHVTFRGLLDKYSIEDIYTISLKKLLHDRLVSRKNDNNIFYFENLTFQNTTMKAILEAFFEPYLTRTRIEYHIVDKSNQVMSIVDYLNYVFISLFEKRQMQDRMTQNFELILPKIGSFHYLNEDIFLSRKERLTLESISKILAG